MRFPGFEGQWELKKLGEICEINPKNSSLPNLFTYIDLESVAGGILLKEEKIQKENAPSRAQRVLKRRDVLYQMVRPYQKNNFYFDMEGDYVASTGYAQIRTIQNSIFIFQYLHYQKFVDKVIEQCTGTSYPAINSTDLSNIPVFYPTTQEQKRIADILTLIDKRIDTQSKIVENLETLIQGLREKLFKQKLRFKDENGQQFPDWEVEKLENVLSLPEKVKPSFIDKDKLLTVKLHLKGLTRNENTESLSLGSTNYFVRKEGQFIYGKQNLFNGAFAIVSKEFDGFLSSGDVPALNINSQLLNSQFLLHYFSRESFYKKLETISSGSGSKRIHEEILLNVEVALPCSNEQVKIADFLSTLNNKVSIEKNLLRQMQHQKKFLLQNLFI